MNKNAQYQLVEMNVNPEKEGWYYLVMEHKSEAFYFKNGNWYNDSDPETAKTFNIYVNGFDYWMKEVDTEAQFLERLKETAKEYGWTGDYTEVLGFVMYAFRQNGKTITREELEIP